MFSTFKQRLLLGIYIFILLSIPIGAYLSTQITNTKSQASGQKTSKATVKPSSKPSTSLTKELLSAAQQALGSNPQPSASPSAPSTTIATSFGPTLSFKVSLEGRPTSNQAGKVFVGIADGALTSNPKFVLNFNVDMPNNGEYTGLSLAGLNPGSQYTALIKSSAQIASSVSFTMSPSATNLNSGQAVNLITGDLNDDNVINNTDLAIIQNLLGVTSSSANWNENADLNKDKIINTFDLGIVNRNIGKVGASGAWTSPIPSKTATSSGSLNTSPAVGAPGSEGYWIWIPSFNNISP